MSAKPDYYQILHVHPDAPREIIKSSYRTLMQRMRMHPDLGGDNQSAAIINEAYAVLMEPEKREAYDKSRLTEAANDEVTEPDPEPPRDAQNRSAASATHSAARACEFCGTPFASQSGLNEQAFCAQCDSPQYMSGQLQEDDSDRRAILRVPKNGAVHFYLQQAQDQAFQGSIEDVSLTGMRFASRCELREGEVLKVTTPVLRAIARVTRVSLRGAQWEVGVQFQTLHFERSRGAFIADCV